MIDLTIIIPAYNCEELIETCIQTIYSQTYEGYEIIIVDDGSTDHTGEICDRIALNHANTCVIHKQNGGVASARNAGIEHAKGQHILFVDADDLLVDTHYVQDMMAFREYDYVAAGHTCRWEQSGTVYRKTVSSLTKCSSSDSYALPNAFFERGYFHACWGKLYSSKILLENNIRFPQCRLSEDSLFNIKYMEHIHSWIIVESTGYCYMKRRNGQNATARFEESDIETYVNMHTLLRKMNIGRNTVDKTMYAQYLACCLRVNNDPMILNSTKKRRIRMILSKPYVAKTLLFTKTNLGEWMVGIKTIISAFL